MILVCMMMKMLRFGFDAGWFPSASQLSPRDHHLIYGNLNLSASSTVRREEGGGPAWGTR